MHKRLVSDEVNQMVKVMHVEHLKVDSNRHNNRFKWVVYRSDVRKSNRRVNSYMNRSIISVVNSFFYRKAKKINTKEIYKYSGNSEAHRLLNRNMVETIVECFQYKDA